MQRTEHVARVERRPNFLTFQSFGDPSLFGTS